MFGWRKWVISKGVASLSCASWISRCASSPRLDVTWLGILRGGYLAVRVVHEVDIPW